MKRINYILAGLFLFGIILMGVGAGIGFWEYSSFEYQGERMLGQGDEKKRVMEYEIPEGKSKKKILLRQCYEQEYTLKEDKKIPENVIQYEVTYNPEYIEPALCYSKTDGEYRGEIYLSFNSKKSDFEMLMENKDRILSDLKNKKIANYRYSRMEKVSIRVNPKTMNKVKMESIF